MSTNIIIEMNFMSFYLYSKYQINFTLTCLKLMFYFRVNRKSVLNVGNQCFVTRTASRWCVADVCAAFIVTVGVLGGIHCINDSSKQLDMVLYWFSNSTSELFYAKQIYYLYHNNRSIWRHILTCGSRFYIYLFIVIVTVLKLGMVPRFYTKKIKPSFLH